MTLPGRIKKQVALGTAFDAGRDALMRRFPVRFDPETPMTKPLLALLLMIVPLGAQARDWQVDAAKSSLGFTAVYDGESGVQELAGNATLLYYMSAEAQEGRNANVEKRKPDFSKFKRVP